MGEIIWTIINFNQVNKNQYLEVVKQQALMTDIVQNYLRVLEVISSLTRALRIGEAILS